MKLLILTQYFPPETGAPQNRLYELGVRLRVLGVDVAVLTAMPNYPQMSVYEGYRGKKYVYEEIEGLKVHRCSIFVSKDRSVVSRLRNYFSFVISSALTGRKKIGDVDVILCESPPLFLGYTAMYLSRIRRAKLVFNVSDLWPESAEKLGVIRNRLLLWFAYRLEAKLYKRASLVSGQTRGICTSINTRFPLVKTWWLPNGADSGLFDPAAVARGRWREENGFVTGDLIFLYAGIIGLAQGLEVMLEAAAIVNEPHVKFVLLGEGPEKERLMRMAASLNLHNVRFMNGVGKASMPLVLKNADAVIVPLKRLPLFKGAIPSKIFEALAMELPLVLGVDGEARDLFVEEAGCGLYFEPGNAHDLADAVRRLAAGKTLRKELGERGRAYVQAKFSRDRIAGDFLQVLKRVKSSANP
jgi:glycosyltransferase involved in cell wall biosynthesis